MENSKKEAVEVEVAAKKSIASRIGGALMSSSKVIFKGISAVASIIVLIVIVFSLRGEVDQSTMPQVCRDVSVMTGEITLSNELLWNTQDKGSLFRIWNTFSSNDKVNVKVSSLPKSVVYCLMTQSTEKCEDIDLKDMEIEYLKICRIDIKNIGKSPVTASGIVEDAIKVQEVLTK